MTIAATISPQLAARGASAGPSSVLLWVLAAILFLVPHVLAVADLSGRYAEQGGIYAWTRRAFGPLHGFLCAWCLWLNNLFFFPAVLLFAAPNLLAAFGPRFLHLRDSPAYSAVFVLSLLWFSIGVNVIGLGAARWLQNLATAGVWGTSALLIGLGVEAFTSGGSATSFAPAELLPREDVLASVALWSAMCFALSGYEVAATVREEVRNPERTIPRGIFLAGVVAALVYVLGSASILVAVPRESLSERSGVADAVGLMSQRLGVHGLGALTGLSLALVGFALTTSWVAGSARVPFAAGRDRVMPSSLARLHPRFRTPHVALVVQGSASSVLFLISLFLPMGGGETTVREAYDLLFNLTILIYFVPYLYLFLALARLGGPSPKDTSPRFRIPGGRAGIWLTAASGLFSTALSMALLFVPPASTVSVLKYEANLLLQSAGLLGIGFLLYARARRKLSASDRDGGNP
jgi:amino acid transporter